MLTMVSPIDGQPGRLHPGIEFEVSRLVGAPNEPGEKAAAARGIGNSLRESFEDQGQLPADIFFGPVFGRVPQPQVHVVNLDLAKAA